MRLRILAILVICAVLVVPVRAQGDIYPVTRESHDYARFMSIDADEVETYPLTIDLPVVLPETPDVPHGRDYWVLRYASSSHDSASVLKSR
ncbi:MAG: hypothetical protein GF309_06960 [Candidatus Lokiarchaeota archaeon]|nr:hypothetical protein [Candidatus Lokiarchaeota archaeon]